MRFAIACIGFASLLGCSEFRPITGPVPTGTPLRVYFATPTAVRLIAPGDTGRVVALREIWGRSGGVSGDTLRVHMREGTTANGKTLYEQSIAIVQVGPGVHVENARIDAFWTGLLLGCVVAGSIWLIYMIQPGAT